MKAKSSEETIWQQWDQLQKDLCYSLNKGKKRDYQQVYQQLYAEIENKIPQQRPFESISLRCFPFARKFPFLKKLNISRLKMILRWLSVSLMPKNKKILEVGCGDGLFAIAMAQKGNRVFATDVADITVRETKKNIKIFKAGKISVKRMDGRKISFPDRYFDLVASWDFLEHLHPDDVKLHLAEIKRVLKKGGAYLIATPNQLYYPPELLHLSTYRYGNIESVLGKNHQLSSPFFTFFPFLFQTKFSFRFRKKIEPVFLKFKPPLSIARIFGLQPVVVAVSWKTNSL